MKINKSLTTVTPFSKLLALLILILFPILGFYLGVNYQKTVEAEKTGTQYQPTISTTPAQHDGGKMCTMEAKECSDGSYVGRTGPNCEFRACPGEK